MKKNNIQITVYRFTGKHGIFVIPKEWCQECDLLIALVQDVVKELPLSKKATIKIRPWFLWAWLPLVLHGAWHAPILIINGKLISQGILPTRKELRDALGLF